MVVQVIGKQHMKGISKKTGNSYDFTSVFCSFSDPHVEGSSCREFTLPRSFDPSKLILGQCYNFEFDFSGRLISISPAKG